MPYSVPGVVAPSLPSPMSPHSPAPRPGHRRSYTFAVDDPRAGPGAFASLGMLPRRTRSSHRDSPPPSNPGHTPTARKFHFRGDVDNDDSSSSSDEPAVPPSQTRHANDNDEDDGPPPPLRLRQPPAFRLTPATGFNRGSPPRSPQRSPNNSSAALAALNVPVPFPRTQSPSSPLSPTFASQPGSASGPGFPIRPPGPARTASTPVILLSNGKPLKSSLKSSSSAPHMPSHHLRARSAPSTPCLPSPTGAPAAWEEGNGELSPGTPKAVHFPAPDAGLEDIRIFKRSARPASVSFPLDDETETETETDGGREVRWAGGIVSLGGSNSSNGGAGREGHGYPFPKVTRSPLNPNTRAAAQGPAKEGKEWRYELDAPGVPRKKGEVDGASMVLLEGMWLEPSSSSSVPVPPSPMTPGELTLHGTLLARNVAFEKHVFVRFTLDGWCTTSEVGARWVEPASAAESPFGTRWGARSAGPTSTSSSSTPATEEREEPGPGWDRFAFSIRLTDYAHARHTHHSHSGRQEGLRETGVGGIGRGLEGRELVLVGRFWAPWVRSGGVGPYVWCDTLSPSSTTPGTQSGVDVSPVSKRPWVGVGGGGSGEWWDNNGGGDYKVGFRCVAVEEAVVVQDAPVPATTAQNGIPFPSAEPLSQAPPPSSPPTTSSPPAQPHHPTLPNGRPLTIPPPPPPRTAHAQALAAKLGRLSLRNYAAPGGAGRTVSLPGMVSAPVVSTTGTSTTKTSSPLAASPPVTSSKEEESAKEEQRSEEKREEESGESGESGEKKMQQPAPGTQSTGGVGLYWPWGRSSAAPTSTSTPALSPPPTATATAKHSPPAPAPQQDEAEDSSDSENESLASSALLASTTLETLETPPTSPVGAGPRGLVGFVERSWGGDDKEKEDEETPTNERGPRPRKEAAEVPLPVSPPVSDEETTMSALSPLSTPLPSSPAQSPSPPQMQTQTTPLLPSAADASSSLYKAFVRQWCFAGAGAGAGVQV